MIFIAACNIDNKNGKNGNVEPDKTNSSSPTEKVAKESFDYGKVENNVYSNKFFNFKMNVPEKWQIQSKQQTKEILKSGEKVVAGDDKTMQAVIEASKINTANLLVVFKHKVGAAVDYNPSFSVIAENLKAAPGVETGNDYLFHTKKLLKRSKVNFSYVSETFEKENVGGVDFYKMEVHVNYAGLTIKQIYYSTVIKRFALSVIISYINDKQKEKLNGVISSIKFSK